MLITYPRETTIFRSWQKLDSNSKMRAKISSGKINLGKTERSLFFPVQVWIHSDNEVRIIISNLTKTWDSITSWFKTAMDPSRVWYIIYIGKSNVHFSNPTTGIYSDLLSLPILSTKLYSPDNLLSSIHFVVGLRSWII